MPMQQARDVIQISMEIKYVKGGGLVNQNPEELGGLNEGAKTIEVINILKELLKAVRDAKMEAEIYGCVWQSMESNLGSCIRKTEESNQVTYHVNEKINNGKQLVDMCVSETYFCSCFKKPKCFQKPTYMNELQDLDNTLRRFCQRVEQEARKPSDTRVATGQNVNPAKVIHGGLGVKPGGDMKDSEMENNEKKKGTHAEGKNIHQEEKKSSGEIHESYLTDQKINGVSTKTAPSVDDKERQFVPRQVVPPRHEQSLIHVPGESGDSKLKQQREEQTQKPINPKDNEPINPMDNDSVSSHSDGLVKQSKKKDVRKEVERSNPSQKFGLVPNHNSSSHPRQPPETKGIGEKTGSSGPTVNCLPMSNDDVSSIPILPPKTTVGWDTSKKFTKESPMDVASAVVSSAPLGFGEIPLAKERFRNEVYRITKPSRQRQVQQIYCHSQC
ncbi:uncharacterized protein LOC110655862 isoform X2 [Hevea brasiliensis]|uniref:uncharacterized protein LOC110655862 isoform X2 n=1 Tax=Hevea brasiliensis TaxID=3981 RepID=UPI0025E0DF5F|nr:uncharacterized protein LOC110655862 isoform X2 [Hevea brasiliensis]